LRVIALIDGEHHPAVARAALDALEEEHEIAAVLFAGGDEKVAAGVKADPRAHYGRQVVMPGPDLLEALRSLIPAAGADALVDLSGEPVLDPPRRFELAAVALDGGLEYRAPGMVLKPPLVVEQQTSGVPVIAVIGTGKRTGKTALGTHLAALLRDAGESPVVVSMGRGGPPEPVVVRAGQRVGLDGLLEIARGGGHAASDYLEDAVLAGVTTVGCRRCGEGPAGETFMSNVVEGLRIALAEAPGVLVLEGSGGALPPVEAHATVCVTAARHARAQALGHLGPLRLLRADVIVLLGAAELAAPERRDLEAGLARWVAPERILACSLRPEPAEPLPAGSRVACFVTASPEASARMNGELAAQGLDIVRLSSNLARREALERDVESAVRERCDVFLTELKAAAIDVVAEAAMRSGARLAFLRNRPVADDPGASLDDALRALLDTARARVAAGTPEARR